MIEIKHLTKSFENITPLKDVSFTINDGEVVSIIGPSGTGKSTLLRCLNLLCIPDEGQVLVDGEDITDKHYDKTKVRKKMGMVFQNFNLFSHLTVIENIMKPQMDILKRSKQESYDKAVALLKMVGLYNKAYVFVDELSGGQKQRIAIARTLAMDPEIILFDEPTSALDPSMVGEVEAVIKSLSRTGKTMIIVTHEMRFAKEISSRVLFMDNQTVIEDGTPEEIFDHPTHDETRRFVKRLKFKEINIDDPSTRLIDLSSNIDDFVDEQFLSEDVKAKLHTIFSSLVGNILFPRLDLVKNIYFSMEHNMAEHKVTISICYQGEKYNPLETDDSNIQSVKAVADKYKFIYEDKNDIRLTIFYDSEN